MTRSRSAKWRAVLLALAAVAAAGQPRVAVGYGHGVLLKPGGTVWTWGANSGGALGREDDEQWGPAQVPGLTGFRDVAAADSTSYAVNTDGAVWAWGSNENGELGTGSKEGSPKPVRIAGLPRIVAIAAARRHAMALDASGGVWWWGRMNDFGESRTPKPVEGLAGVTAIATSDEHLAAVDSNGDVWVWGDHGAGELGSNNYNHTGVARKLPGMTGMVAVGAAQEAAAGVRKDGAVWTIGGGAAGQLGNGATPNTMVKPVAVTGLTGVTAVAGGDAHFVALKGDGTVWSWGYNHFRQLGNARVKEEEVPRAVRSGTLAGVAAVAAAGGQSVAATAPGVVWAWGYNAAGALGADPEIMDQADTPMRPGQDVPEKCLSPLFACLTDTGKVITVCGAQGDDADVWSGIHYRFGPEKGPPDFVYPADPGSAPPALYFWSQALKKERRMTVRFANGAYTYRVYYGEESGGGVRVEDARGKLISDIPCNERPQVFWEYLEMNLPCDPNNPGGAAACAAKKKRR